MGIITNIKIFIYLLTIGLRAPRASVSVERDPETFPLPVDAGGPCSLYYGCERKPTRRVVHN